MRPRDKAIEELNTSGYEFKRHGGNHDIYYNSKIERNQEIWKGAELMPHPSNS